MPALTAAEVQGMTVNQLAVHAKDMTAQEWDDTVAAVSFYVDLAKLILACRAVRDVARSRQAVVRDRFNYLKSL